MTNDDTARIAAGKLIDAVKVTYSREKFNFFLSAFERNEMHKACVIAKHLIDWNFNFEFFYETLCQFLYPPLEFLWDLHILQIMPLEIYLLKIESQTIIFQKFKESISALCFEDCGEDVSHFVQSGIFSYLVNKAYPASQLTRDDEKIKKVSGAIVKSAVKGIFSAEEKELQGKRLYPFFALWNSGILEKISLHDFSYSSLCNFLELFPPPEITDAFLALGNFRNKCAPFHLLFVIEKLVKDLHSDELEQVIYQAIRKNETNWKSGLVVLEAFILTHKEAIVTLSRIVVEIMKEAFEKSEQSFLYKAILIGRQITLKSDMPLHVCYRQWFQIYVTNTSWLKNPKSVLMLIQALNDLVPFENNADCLKVMLEVPLNVPAICQSEYSDYIALLKTRIQDLKPESKQMQGMEKLFSHFEETGKIPPLVLEASIIQKYQFLNEFLPALLVPRVVPRIPDVKEKFIEALDRAGKIPSNILLNYKKSCQQEEDNLIAGINMIDDNFNEFLNEDIT